MTRQPVKIFHNPRCSKSRQSLALLEESGVSPTVIHYLKTPPGAAELGEILTLLGLTPRELMRKGEAAYMQNNLNDKRLSDAQLIAAMIANPVLIERPIVVTNGKAVIGRPPERVMDILSP